jgi:hypothetical protein
MLSMITFAPATYNIVQREIESAIKAAIKNGNWIIRADNDGKSWEGFQWSPLGEWTEASDWEASSRCGCGLHGQDGKNGGYISGTRLVFCDTDGDHISIDENNVKVKRARILLVDRLPEGLKVGGSLDLRGCTGLTVLPEGLTVGGWLNLRGCTGLTALPEGLTVGGWLNLSGCTGLTALPEGLTVGERIYSKRD